MCLVRSDAATALSRCMQLIVAMLKRPHVNGDSNPPILTVTPNSEARFTKYLIRQSYDYLTIMPKLRSIYDGHLIYQTSNEEHKTFLRYDLLAKS